MKGFYTSYLKSRLYFKFKYDEYNILLKQLIQLCYNTCPVRY